MAGKRKEINKNSLFQARFRELHSEKIKTLDELADEFGATRQTVSKWMSGDSVPDIEALVRIADFYNVSTDYLLGRSDTMSADVSVRAAMEYTGLSEEAVEWLHIGLDDFPIRHPGMSLSKEKKKENLEAASALIKDPSFFEMIYHLKVISREAFWEKILKILCTEYANFEVFEGDSLYRYSPEENRDIVEDNYIKILTARAPKETEEIHRRVAELDDLSLSLEVNKEKFSTAERNELHQFQAAKALNRYMDQLVKESILQAEQQLAQPDP